MAECKIENKQIIISYSASILKSSSSRNGQFILVTEVGFAEEVYKNDAKLKPRKAVIIHNDWQILSAYNLYDTRQGRFLLNSISYSL